jgi:hypothetical protein
MALAEQGNSAAVTLIFSLPYPSIYFRGRKSAAILKGAGAAAKYKVVHAPIAHHLLPISASFSTHPEGARGTRRVEV